MWTKIRKMLFRYVPEHIDNPFSLVWRMLKSGKRAALFTLFSSALGILCIPLDLLLQIKERRYLESAEVSEKLTKIFVFGPARSGTTLVFQVLCNYLDVSYLQNYTSLFPRAPITATRIVRFFGRKNKARGDFQSYYGKTAGWLSPSEANHIWNRWVEPDATGFRTVLTASKAADAGNFFDAFGGIDGKAIVAKNNNMNVFADVVDKNAENCLFICLMREPKYLAQSLLKARRDIRGGTDKGYGVEDVRSLGVTQDPIEAICSQITFLDSQAYEMQKKIGSDKFVILKYEEFCADPRKFIDHVSELANVNKLDTDTHALDLLQPNLAVYDETEMRQIETELAKYN